MHLNRVSAHKLQVNPTVLKLTKNQRVLAEALEAVDREIAINERRLAHIDESTDDWGGRLMAEEEHRKALSDAMQTLSKAVKDVRNDVTLIQNPQVRRHRCGYGHASMNMHQTHLSQMNLRHDLRWTDG